MSASRKGEKSATPARLLLLTRPPTKHVSAGLECLLLAWQLAPWLLAPN